MSGGTRQERDALGGKTVSVAATVDLDGGAVLGSIDWSVDGEAAGTDNSITPFLTLGSHAVEVTATTTEGMYDTAMTVVNVVDTRTGQPVTVVDGTGVSVIEVRLDAGDVCDGDG